MNNYAIEMKSVTKEYAGFEVLSKIDLRVQKGSIHGFLGPNGAGKSTSMRIIAGLMPPTSGQVLVLGRNILANPKWAKTKIGLLPETPPLYENMRVDHYLRFVQELHSEESPPCLKTKEWAIARCGLQSVRHRLINNLSRGFKQRIGIAQALVYGPEIIILDEPMVALDPQAIAEIRELILELKKTHTIFLSTHRLSEASRICDDITIIHEGTILKSGSLEAIQESFSAKRMLKASVLNWNSQYASEFKLKLGGTVRVLKSGKVISLQISFKGPDQKKAQMSKFLSSRVGLLEFREEKMELEEIFKGIVH